MSLLFFGIGICGYNFCALPLCSSGGTFTYCFHYYLARLVPPGLGGAVVGNRRGRYMSDIWAKRGVWVQTALRENGVTGRNNGGRSSRDLQNHFPG